MSRSREALRSLPAQMVLTSIALVLMAAMAVGLPALWLVREQMESQAWARVEQGLRASEALYAAEHRVLDALATLSAQRPMLRSLLATGEREELHDYVAELRTGAGVDLVALCADAGAAPAWTVTADSTSGLSSTLERIVCDTPQRSGYVHVPTDATDRLACAEVAGSVWLFASDDVGGVTGGAPVAVVVGSVLDDDFARSLAERTGLEQSLLVGEDMLATNLPCATRDVEPRTPVATGLEHAGRLTVAGQPHYIARTPLDWVVPTLSDPAADVWIEAALPVADLAAAERRLVQRLVAAMAAAAAVGTLLAVLLSRRISRPLASLTDAAQALREGDLETAVPDLAEVREVSLVARALEEARRDLLRSLTDLRDEKAWTDHLLDAIVEGIVTLDDDGRITYFSPGAERITGWRRAEALGRHCGEVFRSDPSETPFTDIVPPPGRREKVTVVLAGERRATLAVTGAHLMPPDRGDARVALVFRDVTDAESMHRVMGHFLANVAHEFLTPLTALAASAEILSDQASELTPSEMRQLLEALHVGILRLHTLVDNLLEGASIEAGRFSVHPSAVPLDAVVAEAVMTMQPLLDRQGQRLSIELPEPPPVVRADPRRTTQVLVNLLSNASRHGPDDSPIELVADVRDAEVWVHVMDRGPGIPEEQRHTVFQRFVYPVADDGRSRYGAGLGLSVVKTIVESQGGTVGVSARDGGGAHFWFTIPMEAD